MQHLDPDPSEFTVIRIRKIVKFLEGAAQLFHSSFSKATGTDTAHHVMCQWAGWGGGVQGQNLEFKQGLVGQK